MRAFPSWAWRRVWVPALAAALAFIALDGAFRLRTVWAVTDLPIVGREPAAPDNRSPSGYAFNQHHVILPAMSTDGMHFLMQTQDTLAGGDLRLRRSAYDGPPGGREVHWASFLRWWTALVAMLDPQLTGYPLALAAERAATWANTALLVLALLVLTPLMARRLGPAPAALLALGLVAPYPLYEFFCGSEYDHHGLAALGGLLAALLLVAGGGGWVRSAPATGGPPRPGTAEAALAAWLPERAAARRWFIAAGVAGAFGLWISAASVIPVLAALGLGALLGPGLYGRGARPGDAWRADPSLWRVWGAAGAGASLLFYLLEYFPAHLGWRLEVNHPVFALAWLGGGDAIARVLAWLHGPAGAPAPRDRGWLAVDLVLVALPPVLVMLAHQKVFWVADPYLWALHEDYIVEFKSLAAVVRDLQPAGAVGLINAVPLAAAACAALLLVRPLPRPWKGLFVVALLPALVMLALAVYQIRWLGICCAQAVAALVAAATVVTAAGPGFRWTALRGVGAAALLGLVLLPNTIMAARHWWLGRAAPGFSPENALMFATRDLAQHLRARVGAEPVRVASGSLTSTWLTYFGGFPSLGTIYWENLAGLKGMGELYGARSPEDALAAARKYGINYLAVCSWDPFAEEFARLGRGVRAGAPAPADAFIIQLIRTGTLTQWLRPVYYAVPKHGILQESNVWLFEVVPDQTPLDWLLGIAQFQLQSGAPELALGTLQQALTAQPGYLPALIATARAQLALGRLDAANATFARLRGQPLNPQNLNFADVVDLAVLTARAQDYPATQALIAQALQRADERSLRRLRLDALYDLLSLTYQLGLADTRPSLLPFARALLPPELRQELDAVRRRGPLAPPGVAPGVP